MRDVTRIVGAESSVTVLKGISLVITQGEFTAIEGPSGAGKSSLLNIVGALDAPTSGDYAIDGQQTRSAADRELSRIRSGTFAFVFQSFHLMDRRPAVDNVELGLLYRGVKAHERRTRALEAMAALGIERLAHVRSGNLSGGERQRVALARALACKAPVVIADEPTGNLDSENAQVVVRALRELHESGTTIVLVTHSPEIAAVASRRIGIADGRVVRESHHVDTAEAGSTRVSSSQIPGASSRLRLTDLLRDSVANISSRGGKTAGLVAAVALAVSLTVGSLGVAGSAGSQVSARFDEHANRDVTVEWPSTGLDDQSAEMRSGLRDRLAGVAGVDSASIIENHGQTSVQTGSSREVRLVTGFTGTRESASSARLKVTWAPGVSKKLARGQLLMGSTFARQLELAPPSLSPVVLIEGEPFQVIGLVTQSPRLPELLAGVLLSTEDSGVLNAPERTRALILTRSGAAQQVARQAPLVVDPFDPTSLTVSAPVDPRTLRSEVEADVSTTLLGLTGLALLAAIAGLANAMVLSVTERRQELGLRRAIGARRLHVSAMILCESAYIGLIGGCAGLALGLGGVLAVTISQRWIPVFDPLLAPLAILGGIGVGAFAGVVAAWRASRIQPSEALRL
ncbi:ABC transporter ATP-binding protein/permease [Leifsonia sp. NPDC080035]|uniref:ABC transporter ATP-binding protein/permease n=1 Tax=Leifsonia sp. NPDC080035 TaxID=3143936 RepID=A0AAU7GE81_9MICO